MNGKRDEAFIKRFKEMNVPTRIPVKKLLEMAKQFKWGTYGRNGDQPLKWKTYAQLSAPHIRNILITLDLYPVKKAILLAVLMKKLSKVDKQIAFRPFKAV